MIFGLEIFSSCVFCSNTVIGPYAFYVILQQQMIEKFRNCTDNINLMMENLNDIERRLAEQEPVSENNNGLRNQINLVRVSSS